MLSVSPPEGTAPAYDAAEKGTLDVHTGPSSVATLALNEKVDATLAVSKEVQVVPIPKPPAPKPPAKKVSKWILWQLWFNTYRYVLMSSFSFRLSEPIH